MAHLDDECKKIGMMEIMIAPYFRIAETNLVKQNIYCKLNKPRDHVHLPRE